MPTIEAGEGIKRTLHCQWHDLIEKHYFVYRRRQSAVRALSCSSGAGAEASGKRTRNLHICQCNLHNNWRYDVLQRTHNRNLHQRQCPICIFIFQYVKIFVDFHSAGREREGGGANKSVNIFHDEAGK